ncbi:hypothetical protein [Streptomyces sp. NPDC101132]|uniref:hypothetical protein n=1 Tax=Streptomyces sp. NPDC101132 TaxID=3366110 RepID=UPI00382B89CD
MTLEVSPGQGIPPRAAWLLEQARRGGAALLTVDGTVVVPLRAGKGDRAGCCPLRGHTLGIDGGLGMALRAVALVGGEPGRPRTPCRACREWLWERVPDRGRDGDVEVYCADPEVSAVLVADAGGLSAPPSNWVRWSSA